MLDPKCNWAVNHLELFPVEINRVSYDMLLRVPGIGVKSARKILKARKVGPLHFEDLKKLGVVLKRAQYFIVCCGKAAQGMRITQDSILRGLLSDKGMAMLPQSYEQLSLFPEQNRLTGEDVRKCLTGQM